MDEQIIRFLQGEATEAEERDLLLWRQAAPSNERRYREVAQIWELSGRLGAPLVRRKVPRAAELLRGRGHGASIPTAIRPAWRGRAAAAAVLLLMGLGLGRMIGNDPAEVVFGATEFTTGATDMVAARLADGSVVRLAPRSRLRVTGGTAAREVWLDGRAFFAVAEDAERPFTVRTRSGEALVLGTRFEVRVDQNELRVLVVEGRVELAASGERVRLEAGDLSRVTAGEVPVVERVEDVHALLDWMDRFLVFESTPVRQVAREIEHRYDIRIELPDSAMAERTVTAVFAEQSVEEVLMVVCRIIDAHCVIGDAVASIEP